MTALLDVVELRHQRAVARRREEPEQRVGLAGRGAMAVQGQLDRPRQRQHGQHGSRRGERPGGGPTVPGTPVAKKPKPRYEFIVMFIWREPTPSDQLMKLGDAIGGAAAGATPGGP